MRRGVSHVTHWHPSRALVTNHRPAVSKLLAMPRTALAPASHPQFASAELRLDNPARFLSSSSSSSSSSSDNEPEEREESISEWWKRINSKDYDEEERGEEDKAALSDGEGDAGTNVDVDTSDREGEAEGKAAEEVETEPEDAGLSMWETMRAKASEATTKAAAASKVAREAAAEKAREAAAAAAHAAKQRTSSSASDEPSSNEGRPSSAADADAGSGAGAGAGAGDDAAATSSEEGDSAAHEAVSKKAPGKIGAALDTGKTILAGVFGVRRRPKKVPTEEKPKVEVNLDSSEVLVVEQKQGRWERLAEQMQVAPLIQSIMDLKKAVAESEVGQAAGKVKEKIDDTKESLQETWDTSQHPLVYNASAAYDGMFGENEWAQAVRAIRRIDPAFDMPSFLEEMRDVIIPEVVHGFLVGSRLELEEWCNDSAMAQIGAVLRARETEGLTMDPNILSISNVDVAAAKVTTKTPPILVVSAMVQQINCMKNKKGEVVDGNEDEIRAVFYVLAMIREYDPETASLHWRVAEMSMIGSQLYL